MSTLRKTVLTTAIIGAGLASTAGSAFATDCHESHHRSHEKSSSSDCTNNVKALNESKNGGAVIIADGAQTIIPANICHILNGNNMLSNNTL